MEIGSRLFLLQIMLGILLTIASLHVCEQGDKNIIKFEGDHNSPRPQSYYDSVSIFFYKTLRPPMLPAARSKLHMGAFKVGNITNEVN